MPNYRVEEKWDPWNGKHVSVTSTPTAGETASTALGLAGLLIGNYQAKQGVNAQQSMNLMWEAYSRGDYRSALQLLQLPLTYWHDDDSTKGKQALVFAGAHMYDEAETKAQIALRAHLPSYANPEAFKQGIFYAHAALVIVARWRGNSQEMLRHANSAIGLWPESTHGYLLRAYAWNSVGDSEQALVDAVKAVELMSGHTATHFCLGETWFLLGKYENAIKCISRSLYLSDEVKQNQADSMAKRAHSYAKLGQFEQAWEDVLASREHAEYDGDRLNAAAIVMHANNETEKAKSTLAMARVSKECDQVYKKYRIQSDELWNKGFAKEYKLADTELPPERRGLAKLFNNDSGKHQLATQAQSYLDTVTSHDEKLPGFSEFYPLYLVARENVTLHLLPRVTKGWLCNKWFSRLTT